MKEKKTCRWCAATVDVERLVGWNNIIHGHPGALRSRSPSVSLPCELPCLRIHVSDTARCHVCTDVASDAEMEKSAYIHMNVSIYAEFYILLSGSDHTDMQDSSCLTCWESASIAFNTYTHTHTQTQHFKHLGLMFVCTHGHKRRVCIYPYNPDWAS